MAKRKKFQLDYTIKSSPAILFDFVSTPSGLAQWFADRVDQIGSEFIFDWDGNETRAILVDGIEEEFARFQWKGGNKDEFFEFQISKTEISNDTVLSVIDFCDEKEVKDQQRLWDSQIKTLMQRIGS